MARGFDVGIFRSAISEKGVMRNNKFLVEFNAPIGLATIPGNTSIETVRSLEYWCEAINMPSFNLYTYNALRYGYGAMEKRPAAPIYTDVQCMFIGDELAETWNFFYNWLKLIDNSDFSQGIGGLTGQSGATAMQPYEISYRTEYVTDVKIIVFDQEGKQKNIVNLREAYPISLSDIQLNWADNNSYMRLPVAMTFTDWYRTDPEI